MALLSNLQAQWYKKRHWICYQSSLNLAREYNGDSKLKREDVKPTKLVDFEDITRHHNVNIMLYEPKKDRRKDAGSTWRLVYGKIQHKNDLPTINMGYWEAIVFT